MPSLGGNLDDALSTIDGTNLVSDVDDVVHRLLKVTYAIALAHDIELVVLRQYQLMGGTGLDLSDAYVVEEGFVAFKVVTTTAKEQQFVLVLVVVCGG